MFVVRNIYKLIITNCDWSVSAWRIILIFISEVTYYVTFKVLFGKTQVGWEASWMCSIYHNKVNPAQLWRFFHFGEIHPIKNVEISPQPNCLHSFTLGIQSSSSHFFWFLFFYLNTKIVNYSLMGFSVHSWIASSASCSTLMYSSEAFEENSMSCMVTGNWCATWRNTVVSSNDLTGSIQTH